MGTQTKDGTIYLPPGGGVMTSGHSAVAARQANAPLNLVRPAEAWVRENASLICDRIESLIGSRPEELHLRFMTALSVATGQAVVWETKTQAEILPDGPEPIVGIVRLAS
jgi:hypothetical protein